MLRSIVAAVAAVAFVGAAFAQEEEPVRPGEQDVRGFVENFNQQLGVAPEEYLDQIDFPLQISLVAPDGEVLTAEFDEDQFRMAAHYGLNMSELALGVHVAGQAARAALDEEALEENDAVVEEELAVRPLQTQTLTTEIQFVGENVALVRTTIAVGHEGAPAVGARAEAEAAEENDEPIVEEEVAVRPDQAQMDLGLLVIQEEGEWRLKGLILGQQELPHGHREQ